MFDIALFNEFNTNVKLFLISILVFPHKLYLGLPAILSATQVHLTTHFFKNLSERMMRDCERGRGGGGLLADTGNDWESSKSFSSERRCSLV